MTFYEKVKNLCEMRGISITALVKELGFSGSTATVWKNSENLPRAATMKKIADYFGLTVPELKSGVDYDGIDTSGFNQLVWQHKLEQNDFDMQKAVPAYLAFEKAQMEDALKDTPPSLGDSIDALISKHPGLFRPKMKKVPILGGIACGKAIFSPNLDEEFALVNEDIDADCALVCKGDSMIDVGINDGDVVYIRQQEMVDNGQIAAVIIGDEITLKRVFYYRDKNKLVLHPANPNYEPFVYTGPELDEIRILGRAVAQLRKIE